MRWWVTRGIDHAADSHRVAGTRGGGDNSGVRPHYSLVVDKCGRRVILPVWPTHNNSVHINHVWVWSQTSPSMVHTRAKAATNEFIRGRDRKDDRMKRQLAWGAAPDVSRHLVCVQHLTSVTVRMIFFFFLGRQDRLFTVQMNLAWHENLDFAGTFYWIYTLLLQNWGPRKPIIQFLDDHFPAIG